MQKILLVFALFFIAGAAYASEKGVVIPSMGKTYPIAEKDALEEIGQLVQKRGPGLTEDLRKQVAEEFRRYQPEDLASLPRAPRSRTRDVDISWVVEHNITDKDGNVLYPKGYKVNPLNHMFWPRKLVVVDASDPAQIQWLKQSGLLRDMKTTIVISDGSFIESASEFKRRVFYLDKFLANRFKLEFTPCVAVQNKDKLRVVEFAIDDTGAVKKGADA